MLGWRLAINVGDGRSALNGRTGAKNPGSGLDVSWREPLGDDAESPFRRCGELKNRRRTDDDIQGVTIGYKN